MPLWACQTTWAATLLLLTARVAGIFLVAPVYSAAAVPWRLRLLMSVLIAQALIASVAAAPVPANMTAMLIALGSELAIGATIGYAARLVLAGVQLGAMHIGQQMGLSLAETFGGGAAPGESGMLRRLLYLLAAVIFLTIGGHREVILALRRTLQAVPLAGFPAGAGMLEMVTALLGASFVLALKVAAPVLVAMLLATVALGALQRTVPQYNTLTIGLPVRLMVGLFVLAVSLGAFGRVVEQAFALTFGRLSSWIDAIG